MLSVFYEYLVVTLKRTTDMMNRILTAIQRMSWVNNFDLGCFFFLWVLEGGIN